MIALPKSLRGLTIAFLALFLAVTVLAGVGTFMATRAALDRLVDQRIESESLALAPRAAKVDRTELVRRIRDMGGRRSTGDLGLQLVDGQGRFIAGNVRFARLPPPGLSSLGPDDRIRGLSSGRVLVRDVGSGMRLAVFAETEPTDHYFAARRRIYLAGFGAIILVVLCGLLLFRRLIGARIDAMCVTAESIVKGDLAQRVPLHGDGGEFDRQAAAFNRMLERINRLMSDIRNVSNGISHQLRTPLAKLRNELVALEQSTDAEPIRESLAKAAEQTDIALEIFDALLRIAEIESGARRSGFQPIDVRSLVDDVIELAQPLADEAGKSLEMGPCDAGQILGDRPLLLQMLLNFVENSLIHADGTRVAIAAARRGDRLSFTVEDDGRGIPAEAHDTVLRPFGRLDRSGTKAGHGLGLPLADAIAHLHGGMVKLIDAAPGLRVEVSLAL